MNATSCKVTVLRQSTVAADIRCLTVQWPDASRPAKAGQFFMLRAWAANETPILSRPISVHDFDAATGALTFLYQVKGEGTQKLAALKEGDTLTVTGPILLWQVQPRQAPRPQAILRSRLATQGVPLWAHSWYTPRIITMGPQVSTMANCSGCRMPVTRPW